MTWVIWRRHRLQLAGLVSVAGLAALTLLGAGGVVAVRGVQLSPNVVAFWEGLVFLPVLPGMFLGAPLVAREAERRTAFLLWTQSQSRMRWFCTETLVTVAVLVVGTGIAQLVISPLLMPLLAHEGGGLMFPLAFDEVGVVPVAYALFAFALGVCCSAGLRRTVAAMFVCLALFFAVRVPIDSFVRAHYLPPVAAVRTEVGMGYPAWGPDYGMVLDFSYLNARGDRTGHQPPCADKPTCVNRYVVTYQPPSRFWPFQLIESAIYLALSAFLVVASALFVRYRGT